MCCATVLLADAVLFSQIFGVKSEVGKLYLLKKEWVFERVSSSGASLSSNPSNKSFVIHRVWSRYTYSYWKLPYRYTPNGLVHMCVERIQCCFNYCKCRISLCAEQNFKLPLGRVSIVYIDILWNTSER